MNDLTWYFLWGTAIGVLIGFNLGFSLGRLYDPAIEKLAVWIARKWRQNAKED